jgi:hypothetical protein
MSETITRIHAKQIIEYIKSCMSEKLSKNVNYKFDYNELKNQTSDCLDSFLIKKTLENYKVEMKEPTWKYYYPNFFKRIWAIITYYVFIKTHLIKKVEYDFKKFKWYHYIIPFEITAGIVINWDIIWEENDEYNKNNFVLESLIEEYTTLVTKAIFKAAYDDIPVDIFITPIKAVESIKINIIVENQS